MAVGGPPGRYGIRGADRRRLVRGVWSANALTTLAKEGAYLTPPATPDRRSVRQQLASDQIPPGARRGSGGCGAGARANGPRPGGGLADRDGSPTRARGPRRAV